MAFIPFIPFSEIDIYPRGAIIEKKYIAVGLLVLMLIIFSRNTFSLNQVKGNSMSPTLNENDWVLSRRLFKGLDSEIEVGSIISFHPPGQNRLLAVKRVVAVSGDTLEIKEGLVYVNGQALNEPYLESGHSTQPQHTFPNKSYWEVPEGHVFVLGYNRKLAASKRLNSLKRVINKV